MTEETAEIQRLDYSKPPPGYGVADNTQAFRAPDGPLGSPGTWRSAADGLLAAWAHYKASNYPPGIEVTDDGLFGWGFQVLRMRTWPTPGTRPVREFHVIDGGQQEARAAAWAWYDRRLELAERLDHARSIDALGVVEPLARPLPPPRWPHCLTWSDDVVADVERYVVPPPRRQGRSVGSKAVLVLPYGPSGQVRVEVYSPDGDDVISIDAEVVPDLIPEGERWGQDNLVDGSRPGVEAAAVRAWPSLRDFRWQNTVCTATYPEAVAADAECRAAEAVLQAVYAKRANLMGLRVVDAEPPQAKALS